MSFAREMKKVPGFTVEFARPWRQIGVLPQSVTAGVRSDPDVIYLNRSEQLLWAAITSKLSRAPLVCHLRHHPFSAKAVSLLGRAAQQYIAVSDFVRNEWINAGLRRDRVHVVHNGVDSAIYPATSPRERNRLRTSMGIDPEARVFLHYGRLTSEKGVEVLLHAWQAANVPENWLLLLVGDATPTIVERVGDLRDPSIRLLPRRDDVTELLGVADVTVLPALWDEPFGRVVIESMAAGVPVIASRRGGIPEIMSGPWERFLVASGDVDSLVGAMREIGEWRTNEPELGEQCRNHVQESFSLSKTVDGVEDVLASVA
jgi:glycosyltransferase involved in cell wall biosynthesis